MMDHYLHNKQKLKAIALYTFKQILPYNETTYYSHTNTTKKPFMNSTFHLTNTSTTNASYSSTSTSKPSYNSYYYKPQISTSYILDALKMTLIKYDKNISDLEIQQIVENVDRSHKGTINFDDFVDLFQKAFEKIWEVYLINKSEKSKIVTKINKNKIINSNNKEYFD